MVQCLVVVVFEFEIGYCGFQYVVFGFEIDGIDYCIYILVCGVGDDGFVGIGVVEIDWNGFVLFCCEVQLVIVVIDDENFFCIEYVCIGGCYLVNWICIVDGYVGVFMYIGVFYCLIVGWEDVIQEQYLFIGQR